MTASETRPDKLRPLRRRPKQLAEQPLLYQANSAGKLVVEGEAGDRRGGGPAGDVPGPTQGWVATAESGERRTLEDVVESEAGAADVRRMAAEITRRLSVRPKSRDRAATRGLGQLVSVPYRYNSDDVDLDRTLEVLTERPVPEDTDIIVRERRQGRRAVVLMVDVSGSMRGEKTQVAAATVGALAGELVDDELAVVAFWKDAVLVKPIARLRPATAVLGDLLRIPAKGLTNIDFALRMGLGELAGARARRRIGILLSDVVHNAGPDPRVAAARFTRLHVLLQNDGEHDAELGTDLARLGGGQLVSVRHHREVAPALNRLLGR